MTNKITSRKKSTQPNWTISFWFWKNIRFHFLRGHPVCIIYTPSLAICIVPLTRIVHLLLVNEPPMLLRRLVLYCSLIVVDWPYLYHIHYSSRYWTSHKYNCCIRGILKIIMLNIKGRIKWWEWNRRLSPQFWMHRQESTISVLS